MYQHDDGRDIYTVPEVMARIKVIQDFEDSKYSDIPKWTGFVHNWTENAVLLDFSDTSRRSRDNWFPFSQLRKAADDKSVYATTWILDQKRL